MSILVTGAKGLVGTRLFQLYQDQHELISADLEDGFDVLDPESLRKQIGEKKIEAIVHLAAFTDVSSAHNQQGDKSGLCYRLNVEGTKNMIDLANDHGAHFVHVSTDFVFDGENENPITELDKANPIEWYGETKYLAELEVQKSSDSWTMMRIAFPYLQTLGKRVDLVTNIRNKLAAGDTLYLFNDQWITPSFIDDIADAAIRFVQNKPDGEIFHVTGPEYFTPASLGYALAEIDGINNVDIVETSVVEYLKKDPRPRQRLTKIDTEKYRQFCENNDLSKPLTLKQAFENK